MDFAFELVSDEAREFCEEILRELEQSHGVPRVVGIRRMNAMWKGYRLGEPGETLFHDEPDVWAKRIAERV